MKDPVEKPLLDKPLRDKSLANPPRAERAGGDAPVAASSSSADAPLRAVPRARLYAKPPRDWRTIKWLTPGIGIKRWVLLTLIGLALAMAGTSLATVYVALDVSLLVVEWVHVLTDRLIDPVALGIALLIGGALMVVFGLRGTMGAVEHAFASSSHVKTDFLAAALQRRKLEHAEHVVAIGGGTGLSTMLRGLKEYSSNITAIVTMADDGGSSGMLRNEGMLPPGDLRNCMAALAEAEPLMMKLFQHRFTGMGALKGHSFGNLVVAAMCEMTGDFETAVRETSRVLAIRGRVLPSTLEDIRLGAELEDGTTVVGQSRVNHVSGIKRAFLVPEAPRALPGVVEAIEEADVIIIGPGSLFTSIIPNLLVPQITDAIKKARVPKIYVCNVMTQPHETAGFKASDHVRALIRHIGSNVITHVLVNNGRVDNSVLERYRHTGAEYVEPDEDAIAMLGVRPLHGNFINTSNLVRHDSQKLAAAIFRVVAKM
jgi:uncharacterized cofD-like protein